MRLAALLIVVFLATASQARAVAIRTTGGSTLVATSTIALNLAQDQTPTTKHEVDINVNHGGRAWWASPVWIAIGVLALIVLILLIIMATRGGGGTTIVRE